MEVNEAMNAGSGAGINRTFWQVAQANADKIAVEDGNKSLSYRQLMQQAVQLAGRIQLTPDYESSSFVAVLADQSTDLVVGILSSVLAGKAYVPLDSSFPQERLEEIVNALSPCAIITDVQNRPQALALETDENVILVDAQQSDIALDSTALATLHRNEQNFKANSPAYALTTSGTTGKPKTIVHTRASLWRSAHHYINDLSITPADKVALVLPCAYTPAAFCIFGAFLTGATLSIFDIKSDSTHSLIRWISTSKVSLLYSTASLFRRVLINAESPDQLSSLRDIHVVGEPLFTSDLSIYREKFSHLFTVHNGLGTSETSCLTRFKMDANTQLEGTQVPVGKPYDDVTVRLLGEGGRAVSPGEVGELVVTCEYFANGYWQMPELSAQKFEILPGDPSKIAYHTGDRAKFLSDGNLLYIGRDDNQIKLNGQRIELGEIESALLLNPQVDSAVVTLRKGEPSDQLVAFIASQAESGDIRKFLAEKLPHYMVPARFIVLDALPLNATGKVDRKALRNWQLDELGTSDVEVEQPASMLELRVLNCFRDILQQDLNINSNFFAEGGDSYKAVELALEIENAISAPVNISLLIEAPTARLLTREIEGLLYKGHSGVIASLHNKKVVDVQPAKQKRAMVCLPGLFGDAFSFRAVVGRFQDEMPIYALEYPGFEKMGKSLDSLDNIVQICFDELQEVYPKGDVILVCYSLGGVIGFELSRKLMAAGRKVESLILLDCYTPRSIKRKYLLDCVREPLKDLYKKVVGRKDEFDAVFSRHDHLNRILIRAVFKYKPQPLNLAKTLLVVATAERSVTVEYKQWWQLINGEFKSSRIDCGHLDLITKEYAPQVCDEIVSHNPIIQPTSRPNLAKAVG